jgi:hypothetical protein
MRATTATGVRVVPILALCAVLALALSVGAVGAAARANGDQAAISKKKKKCKEKPVKCAPPEYRLNASGTAELPGTWVETWSAEVDLKRQSANVCHLHSSVGACYTQDGGSLTQSVTGNVHCGWGPGGTLTVEPQTQAVIPVQDPAESDFVLDFYVVDKTYGFRTGLQYATLQPVGGTTYCPPGPNGEPEQHETITWSHHGADSGEKPGKLGKSLSGSNSYETVEGVEHSLQWELTPKK